jgi:hypothetical protein
MRKRRMSSFGYGVKRRGGRLEKYKGIALGNFADFQSDK